MRATGGTALGAIVALAVVSFAFAAAGAGGTPSRIPGGGPLVAEASPTPQPASVAAGPCQLPASPPDNLALTGDLTLDGACQGTIGAFNCSSAADDDYLAAEAPLSGGQELYLAFNVESFTGFGKAYSGVQLIIELSGGGPFDLHSWQNYSFAAKLNADGSLTVPRVQAPSPSGGPPIDVEGVVHCH